MQNKKMLDMAVISRHIEHLRALEAENRLVLCGPFTDFPGGMVVLRAADFAEAFAICEHDPYIAEGYKTFELRTLHEANRDNNYLG